MTSFPKAVILHNIKKTGERFNLTTNNSLHHYTSSPNVMSEILVNVAVVFAVVTDEKNKIVC